LSASSTIRNVIDKLFISHIAKDYSCISDLTYSSRKKFFDEFGPLQEKLKVPMLNFASYIRGTYVLFKGSMKQKLMVIVI